MTESSRQKKRRALKFGVRTRLIPHIQSLGFERPHTKANRPRWPEFTREWDYGRMRGATTDFLDIYWDKYGDPKFVIDFDVGPTAALHESWARWLEGRSGLCPRLKSGHYGIPWGLLGWGGVWFGPGQSAEAAVDLAIRRVSELDEALRGQDAALLAILQERGFSARAGPGGWWLDHAGTDLPNGVVALYDWIYRLTGSSRR